MMEGCTKEAAVGCQSKNNEETAEIPAWVAPLLDKVKTEICAEVTARVAYSVRIMLNKNLDEMKKLVAVGLEGRASSDSDVEEGNNAKVCLDCVKKQTKREEKLKKKAEKHAQKGEQKAKEKKEKKLKKLEQHYRKERTAKQMSSPLSSIIQNTNQRTTEGQVDVHCQENNHDSLTLLEKPSELVNLNCVEEKTSSLRFKLDLLDISQSPKKALKAAAEKEFGQSSCDSEFEVVSMPGQPFGFQHCTDNLERAGPVSSDESDTCDGEEFSEAQEIMDGLPISSKMFSSLLSASTSSVATLQNFHADEVSGVGDASGLRGVGKEEVQGKETCVIKDTNSCLERRRTPYTSKSGEITVVDMVEDLDEECEIMYQSQGDGETAPIQLERERTPYSSALQERIKLSRDPPAAPEASHQSKDGVHRVDILPENLWKGAVNVAAQAFNTAKFAVENISVVIGPTGSAVGQQHGAQSTPKPLSLMEQLIDMGFTNRALNSELLGRFKNDVEQVIAALLET